jgi:hypothetical protein
MRIAVVLDPIYKALVKDYQLGGLNMYGSAQLFQAAIEDIVQM